MLVTGRWILDEPESKIKNHTSSIKYQASVLSKVANFTAPIGHECSIGQGVGTLVHFRHFPVAPQPVCYRLRHQGVVHSETVLLIPP